jgi:hypothetical protein
MEKMRGARGVEAENDERPEKSTSQENNEPVSTRKMMNMDGVGWSTDLRGIDQTEKNK